MPELERWVLHRLAELDVLVRDASAAYDFQALYNALHGFCAVELSAFYFDVRKDALYCDAPDSLRRRAARTVFDLLFDRLSAWLAPVLVFTTEEAWRTRFPDSPSVHLRLFPEPVAGWRDPALAAKWQRVREVRRVITGALEIERKEKRIGASLQAAPIVYVGAEDHGALDGVDVAELAITSGITLIEGQAPADAFTLDDVPGVGVVPRLAEGAKCQRCWRVLPEVGRGRTADLCRRCEAVVRPAEAA
jgi:isoleucyl-tRNA synthetase